MAPCWEPRLLLLLGAWALAGAAPLCSSSPSGAESVQGLARRAAVVLEGRVLAHSVAEPAAAAAAEGGGEGEEATSPPEQPAAAASITAGSSFSGTSLSPVARAPSPLPRLDSSAPAPSSSSASSSVAWVRVHQVWPRKSGGLRKDALLRVLLAAEPDAACGSSLKEESRYVFFLEPAGMSNASSGGSPSPPLFRPSSPPLETGRELKKEVGRALCTRGCGFADISCFPQGLLTHCKCVKLM